ncbi:MAG: hypothetical protein Q9164_006654 [Protoblastenia rupestris]
MFEPPPGSIIWMCGHCAGHPLPLDRNICPCGWKWDVHATYFDKFYREIRRTEEYSTAQGTAAQKAGGLTDQKSFSYAVDAADTLDYTKPSRLDKDKTSAIQPDKSLQEQEAIERLSALELLDHSPLYRLSQSITESKRPIRHTPHQSKEIAAEAERLLLSEIAAREQRLRRARRSAREEYLRGSKYREKPSEPDDPFLNYNDFRSAADQRTPELRFAKLPSTSTQAQGSLRSKSDAAKESIEVSIPPHPEDLFLLLRIPQYKFATKLVHMDVRALDSDQLFFSHLRKNYFNMRGQFARILSLRKLIRIKFVQFEAYKSELVDIRKTDDIPPEAKKDEYRYKPIPAEIIPPVGENHLMHLYEHPDHAEETGLCLDRMPKKLRRRLSVCPQRGTSLGWGVHFVEGLHWTKLYALGLTGLLLGVLFGVLWAKLRDDVQGGFGIAACIMLGFTFTVGIVQAAFEPT